MTRMFAKIVKIMTSLFNRTEGEILLPCPFCGEIPTVVTEIESTYVGDSYIGKCPVYYIKCPCCGVKIEFGRGVCILGYEDRGKTISLYNRREKPAGTGINRNELQWCPFCGSGNVGYSHWFVPQLVYKAKCFSCAVTADWGKDDEQINRKKDEVTKRWNQRIIDLNLAEVA